jgi:hypothetical protein
MQSVTLKHRQSDISFSIKIYTNGKWLLFYSSNIRLSTFLKEEFYNAPFGRKHHQNSSLEESEFSSLNDQKIIAT